MLGTIPVCVAAFTNKMVFHIEKLIEGIYCLYSGQAYLFLKNINGVFKLLNRVF